MRLDSLFFEGGDPLARFLHLERWVNDGSPSGYTRWGSRAGVRYRPDAPQRSYALPLLAVDACEVSTVGVDRVLGVDALAGGVPTGTQPLPVHPETAAAVGSVAPVGYAQVSPTSSSRTVVPVELPTAHIKLHYPGLLGRAPRELNRARVNRSVNVSEAVRAGLRSTRWSVDILHEQFGAVWDSPVGEIGFLVRNATRLQRREPGQAVVPWFSLTSADATDLDSPSIIQQLLAAADHSAESAVDAFIRPLIEGYLSMALGLGVMIEAHAQNVLVEINPKRVALVIFRDMLDVSIDSEIRAMRGLDEISGAYAYSDPALMLGAWRSWAFDTKLAEYSILPALRAVSRFTATPLETVVSLARRTVEVGFAAWDVELDEYFRRGREVSYVRGIPDWSAGPVFATHDQPLLRG